MKDIRWWAVWRRVQYFIGFSLFCWLVGVLIYYTNYYIPPTCLDGVMNGEEKGVDCGGGCIQICAVDVLQPKVVWSQGFEITAGQYNVVAYVENPNQTAGVPELIYKFELFSNGELVGERSGKTSLPPNTLYPIFEGRIMTDSEKKVTETKITVEPVSLWLPGSIERDQFRSTDINLKNVDEAPRLDVEITNTSIFPAEDIEIVATVFNERGEAVTASQTFVDSIGARSAKGVVFTWPNPIAKTIRSCTIPTDVAVAIDLSGSMNNDGGNPPQPVTEALESASQFVGSLKEGDQVSVVTFATNGEVVTTLAKSDQAVVDRIIGLKIDPKEETGFTNTVEALRLAETELSSERHNNNARRVLVLLTDGLPTTAGEADIISETVQKAREINDSGVEIYAIGLGNGVDRDFIKSLASEEDNAFFAPNGSDLDGIYAEITSSLCEVGPTKIDIIAKTPARFEEIR